MAKKQGQKGRQNQGLPQGRRSGWAAWVGLYTSSSFRGTPPAEACPRRAAARVFGRSQAAGSTPYNRSIPNWGQHCHKKSPEFLSFPEKHQKIMADPTETSSSAAGFGRLNAFPSHFSTPEQGAPPLPFPRMTTEQNQKPTGRYRWSVFIGYRAPLPQGPVIPPDFPTGFAECSHRSFSGWAEVLRQLAGLLLGHRQHVQGHNIPLVIVQDQPQGDPAVLRGRISARTWASRRRTPLTQARFGHTSAGRRRPGCSHRFSHCAGPSR